MQRSRLQPFFLSWKKKCKSSKPKHDIYPVFPLIPQHILRKIILDCITMCENFMR